MRYFLAKTDPQTYSLEDLKRDGTTTWDGVTNPQAQQAMREMRAGDRVFIYHSGGVSAVVGLARVTSAPRPDPDHPKAVVVEVQFVCSLDPPVTLAEIKATGKFSEWALIRQGRLSTMSAPAAFATWMRKRFPKGKF